MNRELANSAKKYNFLEKLEINYYVDAIDQSKWKVAKIVDFKTVGHRHTIRLHFDGYPNNWDQDFDLPASTKMAPFRRFTNPYTGPHQIQKTIYRPQASLNFENPLAELKRLNKQEKQKIKPQWVIQCFRGDMFILLDSLLTQFGRAKPEQYEQVLKFFQAYIQTGIHILKYSLQKIAEISKQNISDPNVIYVNSMHAIVSSLPQILFNFNSMVSMKEKRVKFYNQIESLAQNSRKRIKSFMLSKDIISICKNILEYQNPPHRGFSWAIKKQVLVLLSGLEEQIQFPKMVDNKQIIQALDILEYLKYKQAFSQPVIENIRIELITSLIIYGNFEGKLKGLAEVKRYCDNFSTRRQILKQKILTPNLLNSLTDNSTFNGQIFKRSMPIFEAAAKCDLLTDQILKRIIGLHKDKHELQLKSYYSTLSEFGSILDQKKQIKFFEQFKQFPIDTYFISLLKDFTLTLINHHPVYKKLYMGAQTGFGFTLLWQIIKQNHPPQVINAAIEAFATLAGDLYFRKIIQKYLIQSFSSIKEGKNIENSLKIIHLCLSKNKDHKKQFTSNIEIIDKQFGLIDTIISSLIEAPAISSKTIQSTFQFLEEVNQFLYKKLTVDHIKSLWNLKQCRKSIYKFMRKYTATRQQKSSQKILNKKLEPQQIKEIVNKIFMNKTLMQNYSHIDEQAFRAIDELLISYNYRIKSIQYNVKHTIRWVSIQNLFGLELYLEIAMNTKDQNICHKSLQRFVQFYLRPYMKTSKIQKVNSWNSCVDKLSRYMEDSSKKYIAYSILFQEMKGRMLSINILDPTPVSFTAYLKGQNLRKILTVPRNYSLWKLRQIINQQFKLNNTNFQMYLPAKQSTLDMQRQQDYSIVFIQASKDPSNIAVVISQAKQQHPHVLAIQEFKQIFNTNYGEKIYNNLNTIKNPDDQIIALKILLQIPNLKSLHTKLLKLQIIKPSGWEQVLDSECKPRLCYQLSILSKVKSEGIPWVMHFIKKGGVQHVQKILRLKNSTKTPLGIKDYQYLIELIEFFNQIIQFYKCKQQTLPFNQSSLVQIMKISSKDKSNEALQSSNAYLNYFYLTFNTLRQIIGVYPNIDGQKILTNKSILQTFQLLLFSSTKTKMQQRFPKTVIHIFQKAKCEHILSSYVDGFLLSCMQIPKLKYSCRVFFDLLVLMFDSNFVTDQLYQKVLQFIKVIRFSPPQIFTEKQTQTNQLIHGWLRLTKCLLLKSITAKGKLKSISQTQQKFAQFLITDGLFNESHRFQSEDCRNEAFQILSILNCTKQVMEKISQQVIPMMTKGHWRRQYQWFVKSFKKRQLNTKVGIKNLAATCYINSLIQQLFHITEFSKPLLSIDTHSIEDKENVAYELQKIFAYLKYSNRQVFSTQSFCDTFILDGQPIDPRIQMDIDQFFHTLMDKLEHNLKKIKKQNIIDDVFQGQYSNLIIGQECQHKSERIQHFLSMRLEIINKSSLFQALGEFIKGQILEGQNAYFCEKCDKKVKAVKRVCVKSLPDILILTLKRFQFDFDKMEKFKLNSFCEFPQDLSMQPFMRQSLYENQQKRPPQDYVYKLKGVVIHYGISEAGHYTSYIKIENGEWKYFDDDRISNFNYKDLGQQCFGGIDDNPYSDSTQKIKNAYLLIYERVNRKKTEQMPIDPYIKSEVDSQNLSNKQIQILFNPGLQKFFDSNHSFLDKTYIIFVHLVSLRSQLRHNVLHKCYENCVSIFQSKGDIAQWYLQNFSENMIRQFIIYGHFEVTSFVASLVIFCLHKTFNSDFIKRCMKCLDKTNMVPLNKIYETASQIQSYFKTLAQFSFHQKVYRIIKQDKVPTAGSLSKIGNIRSEFGQPNVQFIEKKDYRSSAELIHSICVEQFKFKNIGLPDVQFLMRKSKKLSLQCAIAKFLAPKLKEQQQFKALLNQLILPILIKIQLKLEDQYLFKFVIILLAKFCQIKDDSTRKRIAKIADIYIFAIKQNIEGYKTMRMILQGMFSLSFNNDIFQEQMVNVFNHKDNKKYIKALRDWMKQADRFYINVKSERLGYWRKPGRSPFGSLDSLQNDKPVKSQNYLSLFNSLLQKHRIDFPDLLSPQVKIGQRVSLNEFQEYEYEVVSRFGLVLGIKNNDGTQRYIFHDDAYPQRSV